MALAGEFPQIADVNRLHVRVQFGKDGQAPREGLYSPSRGET